ncbi:MAG TPA: hypothetical protein VK679_10770 [Gemmatimonadaceae bacterium]|jgi:hypothetical protein|nr:hypothetical protein [Gemmatimonadaceae bacterium]
MKKTWPLLLLVLGCGGRGETAAHLSDELNQAVPHLANPGRVIAVLDSLHISHSSFDPGSHSINGKVRDSSSTFFHHRSIRLEFVFDEQGRLRQRTIRSGAKG